VLHIAGSPEVLHIAGGPVPVLAPGEVLMACARARRSCWPAEARPGDGRIRPLGAAQQGTPAD
jgi:hypothetical protein